MTNRLLAVIVTLCLLFTVHSQLKSTSYQVASILGLTSQEVIKVLAEEQSEMYEKCLKHYFQSIRADLQWQGLSRQQVNRKIFEKVVSLQRLWIDLKNYMVDKLFHKFEMDQLGETFQEEIKRFPDDYFLTFEMYDLLFD